MAGEKRSRLGRYELHEVIGQGAMGVVYKAYDSFLDRTVAVKTYRQDIPFHQRARERFEREVRTASRLSHPNVVVVYDGGLEEGVPFLAMELVEGPTLHDELAKRGRLPREEALAILFEIAEGLAYAHSRDVIHRDLKPANILIAPDGVAKISDFGVAKLLDTANSAAAQTQTIGTPGYMAPEQIQGDEVGPATDIFALAIIAYELLTGERPFAADSAVTLFFQILKTEPRPASEIEPTLPKAVDAVFARALAKKPAERTPDVDTFVEELRRALASTPARPFVAESEPTGERGARLFIVLVLLAVSAAVVYRFAIVHAPKNPEVIALGGATPTAAATAVSVTPQPTAEAPPTAPAAEVEVPIIAEAPPVREVATPPPAIPERPTPAPRPTAPHIRNATIDVTSEPPSADVLVDGFRKGQTPLRVTGVDSSNVLLEIRKPGYLPYSKSLRLTSGAEFTVRATLTADPRSRGFLDITSDPPGAKISLNDAVVGTTPLRLGPLEPGHYGINADFPGFPRAAQSIEMHPGEIHKVNFLFHSGQ